VHRRASVEGFPRLVLKGFAWLRHQGGIRGPRASMASLLWPVVASLSGKGHRNRFQGWRLGRQRATLGSLSLLDLAAFAGIC
jgi:hypothetical protein